MPQNQVHLTYDLDIEEQSVWLTVTPNQAVKGGMPYVQELGDFYSHSHYYTKRIGLDSYLIKYTLSGEGVLEYDGQTYNVMPGQLFWIDCKKLQYYYTSPKSKEWRILWVHFNGEVCAQYYNLFINQNGGKNVTTLPPTNNVGALLQKLIRLYESGENSLLYDVKASGIITQIMIESIESITNSSPDTALAVIPDSIRDARAFIMQNYSGKISLDDLSTRYAMNKFYFQKLFKKYIGFTPNEYLISARMTHAKEFLRTTDMPVSEIACEVGIENTSHFIGLFKKHEGITPNVYRRNWYQNNGKQ